MNPTMGELRRLAAEDPIELARRAARAEAEVVRCRAQILQLRRRLRITQRALEAARRGR